MTTLLLLAGALFGQLVVVVLDRVSRREDPSINAVALGGAAEAARRASTGTGSV